MPDGQAPWSIGRVVRDPARRDEVLGRLTREGELEVIGERRDDWATSPTAIVPSTDKAQQIQGALKDALRAQLEAEAQSIGVDPDLVAIHGRTGVST
jgi:hypothetical protein